MNRPKLYYLFYLLFLCVVIGCTADRKSKLLALEKLELANRNGIPMLNDSLSESLVDYFNHSGSGNERMRAYYILGRTYADMGELPHALETYYKALDCVDTLASDCDFFTLSRVHAQMADVFYNLVQPRSELKELRSAEHFAWLAQDTLMAIECYALQSGAYNYLKMPDSVIIVKEKAAEMFRGINRLDRASQTLGPAITSLLKKDQVDKARKYIADYEIYSGVVFGDSVKTGAEIFYYIKGRYFLKINKTDSAEYLFRKLLAVKNNSCV